jgi:hypothetical protein
MTSIRPCSCTLLWALASEYSSVVLEFGNTGVRQPSGILSLHFCPFCGSPCPADVEEDSAHAGSVCFVCRTAVDTACFRSSVCDASICDECLKLAAREIT